MSKASESKIEPVPDLLYEMAIKEWGVSAQMLMAIEECSELTNAIRGIIRGRKANVAEEIADVEIMCAQLRLMFGSYAVEREKTKKLARLRQRLMDAKAKVKGRVAMVGEGKVGG